jgi:hypothetical protein
MIGSRFRCPLCKETVHVPVDYSGADVRCRKCLTRIAVPRNGAPRDLSLPPPTTGPGAVPRLPWTPLQIFAGSFLFGPLAGGVVAGLNFVRLCKPAWRIPSFVAGAVLFVPLLLAAVLLPGEVSRLVGIYWNFLVAISFSLAGRRMFARWKALSPTPAAGGKYRPCCIRQLVLLGLGCLAVEVAVIVLVALVV